MLENMISNVSNVFVAAAAAVTAIAAVRGYNAWHRQQRAKINHDLAFNILSLVYKCGSAVWACRNPIVSYHIAASDKTETRAKQEYRGHAEEYCRRLNRITEILNDLQPETLHAKILWKNDLDAEFGKIFRLCSLLERMVMTHLSEINPDNHSSIKLSEENDKILCSNMGDEDSFALDLKAQIEKIETALKPKLLS